LPIEIAWIEIADRNQDPGFEIQDSRQDSRSRIQDHRSPIDDRRQQWPAGNGPA
jgi:hypothetical protein